MITFNFLHPSGFLESLDDFYHMSSNMVMLQTTNNVFNKELYDYVKPESLFAWQRVRVANMMANGGKEWAKVMAQYNSGKTWKFVITSVILVNIFLVLIVFSKKKRIYLFAWIFKLIKINTLIWKCNFVYVECHIPNVCLCLASMAILWLVTQEYDTIKHFQPNLKV